MTEEKPVWVPAKEAAENSHMARFMRDFAPAACRDYGELYRWSVEQPEAFWGACATYTGISFDRRADEALIAGGRMPGASWFPGAELNFAANLLAGESAGTALICVDELGRRRVLSRGELARQVAGLATSMRRAGIVPGDRVAAVLPNCAETVITMLAAASIGAVFSSCSPDFGAQAICDRLGQIGSRWLFVCDGYAYAGSRVDCLDKVVTVVDNLPSVEKVVVIPFLDEEPDIERLPGATLFSSMVIADSDPEFVSLPFDHPLFILYSSGTTGKPKCIVHSAGGTLLQHKKELLLHTDLKPGDVISYFTTCGWMMWNWLVSALSTGATVLLYEGSPSYPEMNAFLRIAAEERVAVFGTSPRYLTALEKSAGSGLSAWPELRTILSTGAPLAPESYDFVKNSLGERVQLCSISGGTDLISCFALGNPLLPVYRGELQCRGLGMAVEVFDADGNSVQQQPGELVCTRPFPSMPLGFWNDNDGRYEATYFRKFPGVWAHGDLAELTEHGGLKIYGRSDAVLNPGGVRIGSAEVCAPAMTIDAVSDALAVAHCKDGQDRIVLFVVLQNDRLLDADIRQQISTAIRQQASPRHVPAEILEVPDIPRTMSGKHVELAVKAVIHDRPVENLASLANPEALEYFRDRL